MKAVTRVTAAGIAAAVLIPAGFAASMSAANAAGGAGNTENTVSVAAKKKSVKKTIVDNEVFRQETVNGVTYTASGGHTFRVQINKKKDNVKYLGKYSAKLTATADPAASSELTLDELVVPKRPLRVWNKTTKVEVVKNGKKITDKVDNLYVRSAFSGWVTTKFGTQYVQSGTLTTRVNVYGTSSAIDLSPEEKVTPVS